MRLSVHVFAWYTFVALAVVLILNAVQGDGAADRAAQRQRWRLLVGYALPLALGFGSLHLIKWTVGRARPDEQVNGVDLGPHVFAPFSGYDSFPSGHATQVVLLTVLMGLYFPWSRWVLIPLAVLVCLGRLALERHYPTDVVGGIGLALLAVYVSMRIVGRELYPRLWPRPIT